MTHNISNLDDVIDSRDVIERIEELESTREPFADAVTEGEIKLASVTRRERVDVKMELLAAEDALAEWDDSEEGQELRALKKLADGAEAYVTDWEHGAQLIRDSYFETHAQELAEEIGAIERNAGWPNTCIDWQQAARELQMDYTSVDFDGATYWVR